MTVKKSWQIRMIGLCAKITLFYGSALLFLPDGMGQNTHLLRKKADRSYDQKNWAEALKGYAQSNAAYNAGAAAYQHGDYGAAADWFEKSHQTEQSPALKADALYNLGNALLRQRKLVDAIAAYQASLRLAPNQPDAKKNVQIALNLLRQPPPPPPPMPPPPSVVPPTAYLDRAAANRKKETPVGNLPPESARQLLEAIVVPEEEKNSRLYRQMVRSGKVGAGRRDW